VAFGEFLYIGVGYPDKKLTPEKCDSLAEKFNLFRDLWLEVTTLSVRRYVKLRDL
jgi:hypothetical protein